jgi:septal ring factor EnvC (AmiA/AmiB activator)
MIEAVMYVTMGLLLGCLLGLAVVSLVHNRAVRLTRRRLEGGLPMSLVEIQADKDLLRAEFALSVRRLEVQVEQLNDKNAGLQIQLARKNDVIKRVRAERDALRSELTGLNSQVEASKTQLPRADTRLDRAAFVVRQMTPRQILRATRG